MLKLLYMVPCESVIIAVSGTTSHVSVLEKVNIAVPPSAPERIMVPMKWSIVTLWTREADVHQPVSYEQRVVALSPSDDQAFEAITLFVVSNESTNYRNVLESAGFPVSISGTLRLELSLRKRGDDEWIKHFEYPILVERTVDEKHENQNARRIENDVLARVS